MRFLFVSAPLPGHLDWGGFLDCAATLHRRGHEVIWATGAAAQPLLEQRDVQGHVLSETGWRWPPPAPLRAEDFDDAQQFQRLRMERSLDQWLDVDRVGSAVEELDAIVGSWSPDLLISEMFIAAAGIVAEMAELPFVVAGWPAVAPAPPPQSHPVADLADQRLSTLLSRFEVMGENWTRIGFPSMLSPLLHLSFWSPRWFRGQSLLAQNQLVGGKAPPSRPWRSPWLNRLPMDKPWIFITLGTAFTQDLNFFIAAAHAASQIGGLPILAIGAGLSREGVIQLRRRLPPESAIVVRVNFDEVLPYAAAAIHHGGAGTTHALVTHAVPQIVVPHAADQARQADGVVRSGVGHRIPPRQVTIPLLVQALEDVLPDRSAARRNARSLRDEFAALGGVEQGATLLEEAASTAAE